jgi:MFS family permease
MYEKIKKYGRETFASIITIRNFRLYFIGQAISLCGTWMQTIGQAWLVLKLTDSGVQLGLVTAAQFLPILILGPWGGVIADRFPKRKLLYFTQTSAGILALLLGTLVATGVVQLWMVYVIAVVFGLINVIDNPTRQTFIMEMVGQDHLTNAISLNSTQVNLARVIGPAIGGALIATVGLAPLFFINAISYLAVLFALFKMSASELHPYAIVAKAKGQIIAGFRYVMATPVLRDTLVMMAIIGTLTYEFTVILPLFAQFTFHSGASGYAALTVAMGFGSMLGGLYSASRKKTTPKMLTVAAFFFGVAMFIAAGAPTFLLATIAMMLVGFCSIIFLSMGNVTLQTESAPQMRGRVMALWAVAFIGSTPIGGPIIGWIGQYAGPRWGLATGGIAALVGAAIGAWRLKKGKRTADALEPGAEATIDSSSKVL